MEFRKIKPAAIQYLGEDHVKFEKFYPLITSTYFSRIFLIVRNVVLILNLQF